MPFSWETNAAPAPATGGAFSWEKTAPSPAQQLAAATQKAAPYVGMGDVQAAGQSAPTPPQPLWKKALATVFNVPDTPSLIPDSSTLNQPLQQVAGKWPQAAGIGVIKGAEDLARTAATSIPTSESLAWQKKWQKVHPNGQLPPLTSQIGQQLLKQDVAAGKIEAPPTDLTYGSALDTAYTKDVDQPLKKKLGVTGTPVENLAYGLGEFVVPTIAGDDLLEGTGVGESVAGKLQGASRIAARAVEGAPRTALQYGLMESTKPTDQRSSLPSWLIQQGLMDVAAHDVLPALLRKNSEDVPVHDYAKTAAQQALQPQKDDQESPAQQLALATGRRDLPALPPGATAELTGQTTNPMEGNYPGITRQVYGLNRAETPLSPRNENELNAARTILRGYKVHTPEAVKKVWDSFPELQSEFPQVKKFLGITDETTPNAYSGNRNLYAFARGKDTDARVKGTDVPTAAQDATGDATKTEKAPKVKGKAPAKVAAEAKTADVKGKSKFSKSTQAWADTQEQAARETLQKLQQQHKQGAERLGAGLDPEYMKAYAQLGAAKIARGVANFADWAQEMGSDLGDSAKPYLKQIFQEANKLVNAKEDEARSYKRQYVDDSEFKINVDPKDTYGGTTAKDIQTEFTGRVNRDRLQGSILNDQIKRLIPDKNERAAAQIYLDFGGNKQAIAEWIADEDPTIDQKIPNLDITYRDALQKALNLSDGGKKGVDILKRYYAEAGGHAMETGATQDTRANYANRKWEQRETGGAYVRPRWMETEKGKSIIGELSDIIRSKQKFDSTDRAQVEDVLKKYGVSKKQMPKRFSDIKNLLYNEGEAATPTNSAGKIQGGQYESNTLNTFTRHSKPREFPTTMHGVKSGFTPVTMDAGDLAQMHVGEMSTVNNMRLLGDSLVKNKLAETISGDAELSKDWKTVMSFGGKRIVAPTRLADAMKAITDVYRPSEIAKKYNKLQGLLKTGKVAFGGFHVLNMAKSLLYSSKMGFDFVKNIPKINEMVKDGTFNDVQMKWVRQGLVTARVDRISDIGDEFSKGDDFLSKMTNLPGIKQFFEGAEAINHQVFYNMQTWGKTLDAEFKLDDWAGKHTGATEEETTEAMREISRFENANAGGMNWGALGVTPTVRNAMKMGTLAPDWLVSKIMLGKYALTDSGLTGQYARMRIGTAFVAGAAMTEIYSKLTTGHFTDKNQPGKEGQVEIAPNVWFSFFPAEVDDFLQVVGNTVKGGLEDAVVQYALNKMAPIPKTFGDLAQNESMYYKSGFKKSSEKSAQTTAEDLAPLPIGWMNDFENWMKQAQGKKPATTLAGNIEAATGVGSYSAAPGQTGGPYDKPVSGQGNWLNYLDNPTYRNQLGMQQAMKTTKAQYSASEQSALQEIGWKLIGKKNLAGVDRAAVNKIFQQYNIPAKNRKGILDDALRKVEMKDLEPTGQDYLGLSVAERQKYVKSLSTDEKQELKQELLQSSYKEAQRAGRQLR